MIHPNPVVIQFGSESAAQSIIHPSRKVIEFGSKSAAQSIIHRKTVVIEFGSESAAQSLSMIEHIISSYSNSDVIHFGSPERPRPSVSSTQPISVIHSNPVTVTVTVVIEFRLSIIHRPGPRFAHRSLDPPSEEAPSTDLVNENILRLGRSLGASHAVMFPAAAAEAN